MSHSFHEDGELPDEIAAQFEADEKPKRKTGLVPFWQQSVQIPLIWLLMIIGAAGFAVYLLSRPAPVEPPAAAVTPVSTTISVTTSTTSVTTSTTSSISTILSGSGSGFVIMVLSHCTTPPPEAGFMVYVGNPSRQGNQLVRADLDGVNSCALTAIGESARYPDISPDGQQIAYIAADSDGDSINIMNSDGTNRRLISRPFQNVRRIEWSPDGTEFVFEAEGTGKRQDIFRMNADGSNLVNLTDNFWQDTGPVWVLNGTEIAFITTQQDATDKLAIMKTDGTNQRWFKKDDGCVQHNPLFLEALPGGSHIVYQSDDGIHIMKPGDIKSCYIGGRQIAAGSVSNPVWAHPTANIYYLGADSAEAGSSHAIYQVRPDGKEATRLTLMSEIVALDVWMPKSQE